MTLAEEAVLGAFSFSVHLFPEVAAAREDMWCCKASKWRSPGRCSRMVVRVEADVCPAVSSERRGRMDARSSPSLLAEIRTSARVLGEMVDT